MTPTIVAPPPSFLVAPLQLRQLNRYELLPLSPEQLWCIRKGVVRTKTWNDEGTLITLGYWGVGDVVGQPLSRIQPYEIQCKTDVEISLLPVQVWWTALDAICKHSQQQEELLRIVSGHSTTLRLWQFLHWVADKFSHTVDTGRQIDLAITHQEIAEVINTTRVTVTRILQQFEAEGKLRRRNRRQIILCP